MIPTTHSASHVDHTYFSIGIYDIGVHVSGPRHNEKAKVRVILINAIIFTENYCNPTIGEGGTSSENS